MNLIRVIIVGIIFLIFLALLIKVNIQKKGDSNISVLMRIMTNYLQILAISMSFNLHFPEYMTAAFSDTSKVGNSAGILLSVDCLLLDTALVDYFDNMAYVKMAGISIIPPLLISVTAILYKFLFFSNNQKVLRYT